MLEGAVLCGGAGRRIGGHKDRLMLCGRSLLEHMLEKLTPHCQRVFAVGNVAQTVSQAEVFADDFPGEGPLGGVLTALRRCRASRLLVLPVDLPLLRPEVLELLCRRSAILADDSARSDVPLVCHDGRLQHLVGVYPVTVLELFEQSFQAGERKLATTLEICGYEVLGPDELQLCDPGLEGFLNVNRLQDLERAQSLLEAAHRSR